MLVAQENYNKPVVWLALVGLRRRFWWHMIYIYCKNLYTRSLRHQI